MDLEKTKEKILSFTRNGLDSVKASLHDATYKNLIKNIYFFIQCTILIIFMFGCSDNGSNNQQTKHETYSVTDVLNQIAENGCMQSLSGDVQFGPFTNLTVDECAMKNGNVEVSFKVQFDKKNDQNKPFFDSFKEAFAHVFSSEFGPDDNWQMEENSVDDVWTVSSCEISNENLNMSATARNGEDSFIIHCKRYAPD